MGVRLQEYLEDHRFFIPGVEAVPASVLECSEPFTATHIFGVGGGGMSKPYVLLTHAGAQDFSFFRNPLLTRQHLEMQQLPFWLLQTSPVCVHLDLTLVSLLTLQVTT